MKCISLNVKPLFNIFLIHMHSSKILKSSWGYQVYCVPCLKPGLLSKLGWRIRFLQHQIDVVTYSKCMKMSDITFFFSLHQKLCFALFGFHHLCVFVSCMFFCYVLFLVCLPAGEAPLHIHFVWCPSLPGGPHVYLDGCFTWYDSGCTNPQKVIVYWPQ